MMLIRRTGWRTLNRKNLMSTTENGNIYAEKIFFLLLYLFFVHSNIVFEFGWCNKFVLQSLESLLNSVPEGKMIIAHYRCEGKLNDFYRQKLGDELIREELKDKVDKRYYTENKCRKSK